MGPQAYLLQANEELYEKDLTPLVEDLLKWDHTVKNWYMLNFLNVLYPFIVSSYKPFTHPTHQTALCTLADNGLETRAIATSVQ